MGRCDRAPQASGSDSRCLFTAVLGAGSPGPRRRRGRVPARAFGPPSRCGTTRPCAGRARGPRDLAPPIYDGTKGPWRLHPVASQRPRLLWPSPWGGPASSCAFSGSQHVRRHRGGPCAARRAPSRSRLAEPQRGPSPRRHLRVSSSEPFSPVGVLGRTTSRGQSCPVAAGASLGRPFTVGPPAPLSPAAPTLS